MTTFTRRTLAAAAVALGLASVASISAVNRYGVLPTKADFARIGVLHSRFRGSRRWLMGPEGVFIEASGGPLPDTGGGQDAAVERAMSWFSGEINHAATEYNVPVEFLMATLAVETVSGMRTREQAIRARGGSGEVGAMQILPATARSALGVPRLTVAQLHDPMTNIRAGAAYIAIQSDASRFDLPLVAAGYNAGGVYEDQSARNPWRMRCWPLGTGGYVTKQARYFNAAVAYMARNPEFAPQAPTWARVIKAAQ